VVLPAVTVSLGLALYPIHGQDGYALLKAADNAMYCAKHAGRDRLMCSAEVA
jgi:GGDEF domain-containing protein